MKLGTRVLATVLGLLLCGGGRLAMAQGDKDLAELESTTLTMDTVTRLMEVLGDLGKMAKEHPELKGVMEKDSDKQEDLDSAAKRIEGFPPVAGVLKQHGFTARQFVVTEMCLFQAGFAAAMKEKGQDMTKTAHEAHINPANITFVETHKQEIEDLQKKYGVPSGS